MFRDARALDRQRTATSFDAALQRYASEAEKWFDGSVNSIDRRLGQCERLLHSVRATVARLSTTDSQRYLLAAEELKSDHRALQALREDMLTGASNRADGIGLPGRRTATPNQPDPAPLPPVEVNSIPQMVVDRDMRPGRDLTGSDRRWVTLESAKFVAANRDALDDLSELSTRATHHAQLHTSTFTRQRSAAVTRAFVATVAELGRQTYVPTTLRTAALDMSFVDEAMYL